MGTETLLLSTIKETCGSGATSSAKMTTMARIMKFLRCAVNSEIVTPPASLTGTRRMAIAFKISQSQRPM